MTQNTFGWMKRKDKSFSIGFTIIHWHSHVIPFLQWQNILNSVYLGSIVMWKMELVRWFQIMSYLVRFTSQYLPWKRQEFISSSPSYELSSRVNRFLALNDSQSRIKTKYRTVEKTIRNYISFSTRSPVNRKKYVHLWLTMFRQ